MLLRRKKVSYKKICTIGLYFVKKIMINEINVEVYRTKNQETYF